MRCSSFRGEQETNQLLFMEGKHFNTARARSYTYACMLDQPAYDDALTCKSTIAINVYSFILKTMCTYMSVVTPVVGVVYSVPY